MLDTDVRRHPIIGIPIGRHLPSHSRYLRLRRTYSDAVAEAGGVPVLIPPMPDADAMGDLIARLDGLLFPGGWDVGPDRYGEAAHPTVRVDEVLDELELQLAARAIEARLPTLGVCRGQQVLNVALGGSLVQDLPSEGAPHPQSPSEPRLALAHRIDVERDSRLAAIFGATSFDVNSFHHQAVRRLGCGLRAVAWSPDGVVEAVESSEHPWLLAVQFHPEDLVSFHEPSQRLFRAFVRACASGHAAGPATIGVLEEVR